MLNYASLQNTLTILNHITLGFPGYLEKGVMETTPEPLRFPLYSTVRFHADQSHTTSDI